MAVEEDQPVKSSGDLTVKILTGLAAVLILVVVAVGAFLLGREDGSEETIQVEAGQPGECD